MPLDYECANYLRKTRHVVKDSEATRNLKEVIATLTPKCKHYAHVTDLQPIG